MILDVQKASMWKRISAYLFDVLLLIIVIASVAWLMSTMLGYGSYSIQFNDIRSQYESEYGVDFDADYNSLTDDKKLYLHKSIYLYGIHHRRRQLRYQLCKRSDAFR